MTDNNEEWDDKISQILLVIQNSERFNHLLYLDYAMACDVHRASPHSSFMDIIREMEELGLIDVVWEKSSQYLIEAKLERTEFGKYYHQFLKDCERLNML